MNIKNVKKMVGSFFCWGLFSTHYWMMLMKSVWTFPQQQAWYSIIFNGYDCHIDMGSDMVDSRKPGNHQ